VLKNKKMGKRLLVLFYHFVFSFLILSFFSCLNQEFNLNDETLDGNVTLGNSINIPVGDIQRISVYEELKKMYNQLKVGDEGVLYVEYDGKFSVEFPKFTIPKIEETKRELIIRSLAEIPSLNVEIPLWMFPEDILLVTDIIEENKIETPEWGNESELKFNPTKIGFDALALKVGLGLSGIELTPEDNDAKVTLTLTFPDDYEFENSQNTIENTIDITIPFADIKDHIHYLETIKVKSYTLSDQRITYTASLNKGNAKGLKITGAKFKLLIEADDPNPPKISYLQCNIEGTKDFTGTVDGFGDLQDAFGKNDMLKFRNPSLSLNLATNLDAKFNLGLDLLRDAGSGDELSAFLNEDLPLQFGNSTEPQFCVLTKDNLVNFDKIISTPFPNKLDYNVKLIFNKEEEVKLPPPDKLELSAGYSFKIPFDFEEISLSLKDTITNIFDEDTYEQIFSHAKGSVSIEADKVDISIGENIELTISAAILDADFNEIIDLGEVLKDKKLSIAIKEEDMEKMENARHLKFMFRLSGGGVIITDKDFIRITGVRLVSSSGIHYEF
jgi:hypothetical protein